MSSTTSSSDAANKTRVCLKNLPRHWTESDVRAFVRQRLQIESASGGGGGAETEITITDCRVLRRSHHNDKNSRGDNSSHSQSSRGVAFCGFRSPAAAARCVRELHRVYAQTSRLTVEWAVPPAGRNNSSSSKAAAATQKGTAVTTNNAREKPETQQQQQQQQSEDVAVASAQKKKEEYLSAMLGAMSAATSLATNTKQRQFWANDDDDPQQQQRMEPITETGTAQRAPRQRPPPPATKKAPAAAAAHDDDDVDSSSSSSSSSDDDDDDDDGASSHSSSDNDDADPLERQQQQQNRNENGNVNAAMDFLRSKQKAVDDLDEKEQEADDDGGAVAAQVGTDTVLALNKSSSNSSDSSSSDSSDDDDVDDDGVVVPMKPTTTTDERIAEANEASTADGAKPIDRSNHHGDDGESNGSSNNDSSNNRLFLRNLPFAATEDDLCRHLRRHCPGVPIAECHVARDNDSSSHATAGGAAVVPVSKGFAFCTLPTAAEAAQVRDACDGSDFQGRLLHILPARRPPLRRSDDDDDNDNNNNASSYKRQRERERRAAAPSEQRGWSASFVRGDAVADNLAGRLGLRMGDILGVKDGLRSGAAAVRLALGEAAVVQENREYFAERGIDMEALVSWKGTASDGETTDNGNNRNMERSRTSFLVKNLPHDTAPEELQKVFGRGDPTILLPPSRTIAVVEYRSASDAKAAFRRCAYRRFKSVPLYLEWAPLASQTTAATAAAKESKNDSDCNNSSHSKRKLDETAAAAAATNGDDDDDDDDDLPLVGPTATLYVKNLNFATTEEQLHDFFAKHSPVRAVRIPKKVAPVKKTGGGEATATASKELSMGFGFVEFASQEAARGALKKLQGVLLDGHAVELKPSSNAQAAPAAASSKVGSDSSSNKAPSKLMVRNVPFQATRKELLQLFGSFGQLKRVRLPKKFDGRHRGFAFVEYLTGKDAANAMKALSRTHLYGRHLVLEWAAKDDEVEDLQILREKAGRDLWTAAAPKGKRIKFD